MTKKTYSQKPTEVKRQWLLIDASELTLGRVAAEVAKSLIGKDKPTYTPHVDGGDYVVVINAKQVKVTGDKELAKRYYHYTGYVGGIKFKTLAELRQQQPEKLIEIAVRGMLPDNKLRDGRLKRLKVYSGAEHEHQAQNPQAISLKKSKTEAK